MPLLLCPNCGAGMKEVERRGVLLDVCPQCGGVWLDRGELEKLLAEARAAEDPPYPGEKPHPKKKKRFLEIFELFD